MGIFLFSCFGTMTSPTPKSTSKGVRVFLIRGSQHTWTFPNGAKIPLGKRAVNRVVAVPLSVGAVVYTFASGSPSRSSARVSASVLFRSHHIHRFRIIREAALRTGMEQRVSCHSLRKTFGYHAWRQGIQPALLMELYNHSSYRVTRHYLGIDQDDRDQVFLNISL